MNPPRRLPPFADLHKLDEDTRIDLMGSACLTKRMAIGFVIEKGEKLDRCLAKLREKHPAIRVPKPEGTPFPPGSTTTVLVRLLPPEQSLS